jgi:hypothetical protein
MSDLEHACRLLEVDEKFLQPFDVTDPFNTEAMRQSLPTSIAR